MVIKINNLIFIDFMYMFKVLTIVHIKS